MTTALLDAFKAQPEYELFRKAYAERKAPLVVISGSGLSTPAGLPTWPKLRALLQDEAEKKSNSLNVLGEAMLRPRVEALRRQPNNWVAFKLLRETLTPPVYETLVETFLDPSQDTQIPEAYELLLKLNPLGFVTLNLDKFAGEAVSQAMPGRPVMPIYGKELAQKWHLMRAAKTFLIYLHGGLHDPATWVLTQDDLTSLQGTEGHQFFLKLLFTDYLVLFVGISADDISLSKPLLEITEAGFRPRNLFWLSTRLDAETSDWAGKHYISLIRYAARSQSDHAEHIRTLVTDCISYSSIDQPEPPLPASDTVTEVSQIESTVEPDALAQEVPEKIRLVVSSLLENKLKQRSEDVYAAYREFCEQYDYAVHRAFYKAKSEKFKTWFGYQLQFPPLGKGNFGEVFSGYSPSGEIVAVKIMHESIFGNDDMLGGFRRGVRSMEIVTDQKVAGMVTIKDRFELPPTIVMPYVAGLSLEEALRQRPDLPWILRLRIAQKIGEIVSAGHALPQTILHRDLKPSNVMIENFEYQGIFDPDIVVLDFDMSWHKGSKERDIVFESRDDFGYLAPEQTDPTNKHSARSTRVDSYGFGMILYYIFGIEAPRPNEALSDRWLQRALRATQRDYDGPWKSAPQRLARLITRATQIDQGDRIDFATMVRELGYLQTAIEAPGSLDNPELWAEEIMANLGIGLPYMWNDAIGEGLITTANGLVIKSSSNLRNDSVIFIAEYSDVGVRERSGLAKYLATSVNSAEQKLRAAGWQTLERRSGGGEALVRVEYPVATLKGARPAAISSAGQALKEFAF